MQTSDTIIKAVSIKTSLAIFLLLKILKNEINYLITNIL